MPDSSVLCAQARFAVLSAMDTYLHSSPAVQRAAVRRWQPIAALFPLLWDEMTRKVALSMVDSTRPLLETVSRRSISMEPVIAFRGERVLTESQRVMPLVTALSDCSPATKHMHA